MPSNKSFSKMRAAMREVQTRMEKATGELLDAEIAKAAVTKAVSGHFNTGGIDLAEFRILSGIDKPITPLVPLESPLNEVHKLTLYGQPVTATEAVDWVNYQARIPRRKINVDVGDIPPMALTRAMDTLSLTMEDDFRSIGLLDPEADLHIPAKIETNLVPLGDTTVTTRDGGAYRSPGKQAIAEVLAEAGLVFTTVVHVNHPDGAANITPAQADLISRLNDAHGNITFLHELAAPVNMVLLLPKEEKRPGFFRRMWTRIAYRFGLAAAGIKEA